MEDHLARAAEVRCPVRLHFGAADPFVPLPAVETIRTALDAHLDVRIVVHDGATHGFTHRTAPPYDERAEGEAMASVRELVS
jgi:carboxymethylenebutenolidase